MKIEQAMYGYRMVDMSKFEANEGDLMLFDCLFNIHLD